MNILHLQTELNITCGVTKMIYLITKNSPESDTHFIMCLEGDAILKFNSIGIDPIVLANTNKNLVGIIKAFYKIFRFCKLNDIDIIHSHHRFFDVLADFVSKFHNVQTIMSVQSKVFGFKWLSYRSSKIIVCSNTIKNHLINNFGIEDERITLIYNFVDEEDVVIDRTSENIRKELTIKNSSFVIGFIGRFDIKEKGLDVLINAFKNILKFYPETILLMIGKGPDEEYINSFKSKYNLPVIVLSPRIDVYNYYNICDLIILPSNVEPFSLTALETGIMGKPLIASNVDGNTELITDEFNGLLFQKGNIDSLTEKILKVLGDQKLLSQISSRLQITVKNNYSKKIQLNKYYNLYRGLE